jgi:hypothetical protein
LPPFDIKGFTLNQFPLVAPHPAVILDTVVFDAELPIAMEIWSSLETTSFCVIVYPPPAPAVFQPYEKPPLPPPPTQNTSICFTPFGTSNMPLEVDIVIPGSIALFTNLIQLDISETLDFTAFF